MLLHVDGFADIVSEPDSSVLSLVPEGPGLPPSLGMTLGGLSPRGKP